MLQEGRKFIIVELFLVLKAETFYQFEEVNVFGVYLKAQLSHDALELILK
jgi:hypothetical protein